MPRQSVHFEATLDEDVFGPVKCLQMFAAQNVLPDYFIIERNTALGSRTVAIRFNDVSDLQNIARVFAKIVTLPSLRNWRCPTGQFSGDPRFSNVSLNL